MTRKFCALATILILMVSLAPGAMAGNYILGPMDKLKIRIGEWQTSDGTLRDWSSVNGDYTVSAAGTISFPFLGSISVEGKTASQVASVIGVQLQHTLGLLDEPSASVEVAQFRPVFITGDLDKPGQYPYQPGLTVGKAVALAGGLRTSLVTGNVQHDFIDAKGKYDVIAQRQRRLFVVRARLKAEIAGKDTVEVPQQLEDDPNVADLMAGEQDILDAQQKRIRLQLNALSDLKKLLNSEIESLGTKNETQQKQLELLQDQLSHITGLSKKGLINNSTVLNLQQEVADLQGRLLDIDTATLTAKQEINKATRDEISLKNDRAANLAQQLQDTNDEIKQNAAKLSTYRDLMLNSVIGSMESINQGSVKEPAVDYTLVRTEAGKTKQIAADSDTPVVPGDLVRVHVRLSNLVSGF
jgi:exopolysaccharide production protein ExoF